MKHLVLVIPMCLIIRDCHRSTYHMQRHLTRALNSALPTAAWSVRNILPDA